MSILGYTFSPTEIVIFSAAAGVGVATVSLLLNMLWDAAKHVTGGRARRGRRCAACMEPAEPGGYLCYKHARISSIVRSRRPDAP
jgi:hypothetical protein